MSRKLDLAIVGCGDIAAYAAFFARINYKIRMQAFVDPHIERAEKLARRYRVKGVYTEYKDMLDNTTLDAVYLAVPHDLHEAMILQAVDRGLQVLVEKPVTRTVEEALRVAARVEESDCKVGVNYQYRYDRACYALARAVQRGDLGKVRFIQCTLPWKREVDYFVQSSWHAALERAGGGTLITQGSHLLDIALWAAGHAPVRAVGDSSSQRFKNVEVEDTAFGIITLADGARIQISSSMAVNPEQPLEIKVFGEYGTGIYTNEPRPHVRFLGINPRKERPPTRGFHALQRSLEGFRAWVMDDRPYLIPIQEAIPVLAAVEAIYTSANTQQTVEVDTSFLKEIQ